MEIKGIKYIAPIFDNSGYAKASRGNILALHKLGVPLTLAPVSFEQAKPDLGKDGEILKDLVGKDIDYNIVLTHLTPEFWQQFGEPGKTNLAFTIWETEGLHPTWPKYMNASADKVLVGCHWNKEVFKIHGVEKPIGVVPHGINMSDFDNIEPYEIKGVSDDTYVFYSIFQWIERKNPNGLLRAYWSAFGPEDNVALVLKTYRFSYEDKEKELIRNLIKNLKRLVNLDYHPPVYLISHMLSEEEILGLHARADCYVSLDRGEGFGLSPFTAGACGNPIIVTNFGGVKEYAKDHVSYRVDCTKTPVFGMPQSPWYKADQLWAEPDLNHAMCLMRHAYENKTEAFARGQKLRNYIEENFSWEVIGKRIIEEIKKI